jgi:uncharacterized integral membrane protein
LKRIASLLLLVPLAVLLIVLSVANRDPVALRLDPFNAQNPALALELPFFVHLFAAVAVGAIAGGVIVWLRQGRFRREAKERRNEAARWRSETEAQKKRADELAQSAMLAAAGANLPAPSTNRNAA